MIEREPDRAGGARQHLLRFLRPVLRRPARRGLRDRVGRREARRLHRPQDRWRVAARLPGLRGADVRNIIDARFSISEQVVIDGEQSIVGTITAFALYSNRHTYEVQWFANGALQTSWFDDWRLRERT